jgi:Sulfotransferase family
MTQDRLIFLIGAPRSGTTLLARMMGAHSMIYQRAEPHLITPIAHLGYFGNVQKAPYDPINVEQAIHEFVADLPRGEADYLDAIRAYTDTLYERMLATAPGKRFFLDKTPAYALVLPFLVRLYPGAHYVVLARHPLAVLTSYVQSFFDGDYRVALAHNPILARYVPALARLLRDRPVPLVHVKYEELVREPETHFRRVCEHLGVPFEPRAIAYGERGEAPQGLGDPTGVQRHTRPVTTSVSRWAAEIAANEDTLGLVSRLIDELDPADLETLGYPRATIVAQLAAARGAPVPTKREVPVRYALERKLLVALRRNIHHNAFGRMLKRLRFALDVVLRE